MYNSRNNFKFIGNLGKDAETRFTPTGAQVVTFSVAVNEAWTDAQKVQHKRTDWFDVEVWGPRAAFAATLKKGTPVLVEAKVKTGTYKSKLGEEHKTWIMKAHNILKIDYTQIEAAETEESTDVSEDAPF